MYKRYFKVLIDWFIAFFAIILLFPLLLIVAILIRIDSVGNPIFIQERLGYKGKVFKLYKFRSMSQGVNKMHNGKLFDNDPRISKVGHFIRKTSIDELPQLLNILKTEMSFIGPRPPVTYYPKNYDAYTEFEKKRFLVRPGISGLAQIRCREIHDWNINIPIDVEYVENFSFKNDVRLFAKSLLVFFKTTNIYRKN